REPSFERREDLRFHSLFFESCDTSAPDSLDGCFGSGTGVCQHRGRQTMRIFQGERLRKHASYRSAHDGRTSDPALVKHFAYAICVVGQIEIALLVGTVAMTRKINAYQTEGSRPHRKLRRP